MKSARGRAQSKTRSAVRLRSDTAHAPQFWRTCLCAFKPALRRFGTQRLHSYPLERIKKSCSQCGARIFGLRRVVPIIGLGRRSIPANGAVTEAKRSPSPKRPLPHLCSAPAARLLLFLICSSQCQARPIKVSDWKFLAGVKLFFYSETASGNLSASAWPTMTIIIRLQSAGRW